jgi:hypothetical protein
MPGIGVIYEPDTTKYEQEKKKFRHFCLNYFILYTSEISREMKGVVARLDIPLVFEIKVGRHVLKILYFLKNAPKMIKLKATFRQIVLEMVWRGSVWCGVAHYGAAWPFIVRRGSV